MDARVYRRAEERSHLSRLMEAEQAHWQAQAALREPKSLSWREWLRQLIRI